jgi:hypothetical protein
LEHNGALAELVLSVAGIGVLVDLFAVDGDGDGLAFDADVEFGLQKACPLVWFVP